MVMTRKSKLSESTKWWITTLIAISGIVAIFFVPDVRRFLGLENPTTPPIIEVVSVVSEDERKAEEARKAEAPEQLPIEQTPKSTITQSPETLPSERAPREPVERILINESHDLKISSEQFSDLKIVVPEDGSLILSLKSYAECTFFVLFNEQNGKTFKPTNRVGNSSNSNGGWGTGCQPPIYNSGYYSAMVGFNSGDNIQVCTWNSNIHRFEGNFTFILDAGTYYLRIIRGQTGSSTANLSIQLKALK